MTSTKIENEKEPELQWDDPSLREVTPEYDENADLYTFKLPPDNVDYDLKLKLGDKGIYPKKTEKSGTFAVAEVEMYFVAPGEWFDGRKAATEYMNSIINKGQPTSAIHNLLRLLGEAVPNRTPLPDVADKFKEVLESEPLIGGRFQWQAQSQDVQEAHDSEDDSLHNQYKASRYNGGVFLNGMRNFPQKEDGEHNPEVKCPISDADVRARLKLLKFMARK